MPRLPGVPCAALAFLIAGPFVASPTFSAEPETPESEAPEAVAAGHSYHGEAFNEGPRQAAQLMDGLGEIRFPTSAEHERTQAFFEQGVAQLHGFWYLEAERSFRQAAAEEPELAIAYWGMAMANANNEERARGLIDKAMELREAKATARERRYIEALDRYLGEAEEEQAEKQDDAEAAQRKRAERYLADLEEILHAYPDDIEAKAFLAVHLWMFEREGVTMPSRYAVDALLGEVFAAQPMHPAHHYRIHLWDRHHPENALESAALCGPSLPAIAHMWHMPGHIYSRLHRYADAAWQQEASARVDHAHIARARLMPDQIHNFAHNNEWLTRNLIHIGRVQEALAQARNLVSLPRHPRYNSMEEKGSYRYGHQRLLQVLTTYGLWQQLIEEAAGPYLAPTGDEAADDERAAWLAVAHHLTGAHDRAAELRGELERKHRELEDQLREATEPEAAEQEAAESAEENPAAENPAAERKRVAEELEARIEKLASRIARIAAAAAAAREDAAAFARHAEKAELPATLHARWLARAGEIEAAVKRATEAVEKGPGEVPPLAVLVDLLWRQGEHAEAKARFAELRKVARDADRDTPLLARLGGIAEAVGASENWRIPAEPPADLGARPPLEELGPFRWEPYTAPSWQATDAAGATVRDIQFAGRPRIVIFYLGFGCLHCVEQLHAFAPHAEAFRQAGIELVAISTETTEQLRRGLKDLERELPIPLLADPHHEVFQQFRCWDDFEQQPLHGTFLIDAAGKVRWQDIGHEPFTEAEFLVEEAQRLLALDQQHSTREDAER